MQAQPAHWCSRCRSAHSSVCKQADKDRGTSRQRGYTTAWDKASRAYLATHPLCAVCGYMAQCTDHIIPHRGDMTLFWNVSNWQALCNSCHATKTARGE